MKRAILIVLFATAACAIAEAQTQIYLKKDHIYAGAGGGEIAVVVPAPSDSTAPTAPSSLGITSTTATTVALSWTGSTDSGGSGLLGYKVYRAKGSGVALPVGTVNSSTTAFTDSGPLEPNSAYTYTIIAVDAAQNHSSASNSVNPTTSASSGDSTAPSAPSNLRGIPTTRQPYYKVRLDWDPATDAGGSGVAGYKVYRDDTLISGSSAITNRYYEDSTNTANTAFTYKVKTVDGQGNLSGYSNAVVVTTLRQLVFFDDFNRADENDDGGLFIRSNTLQHVPYAGTTFTDRADVGTLSSFRASVSILSRNENTRSGIAFWGEPDKIYRVGEFSGYWSQRVFLEYYWLDGSTWEGASLGISPSNLPPGPGTLRVEADSSTRRIKVYWNGTLQIDFTETDTSRPNSGEVTLWNWAEGPAILDDFLVEQ